MHSVTISLLNLSVRRSFVNLKNWCKKYESKSTPFIFLFVHNSHKHCYICISTIKNIFKESHDRVLFHQESGDCEKIPRRLHPRMYVHPRELVLSEKQTLPGTIRKEGSSISRGFISRIPKPDGLFGCSLWHDSIHSKRLQDGIQW